MSESVFRQLLPLLFPALHKVEILAVVTGSQVALDTRVRSESLEGSTAETTTGRRRVLYEIFPYKGRSNVFLPSRKATLETLSDV